MTCLVPTRPRTIMIHQVTPNALPKFHMWTQLMISLVPIPTGTSTLLQVTLEALPKFHRQTQLKQVLAMFDHKYPRFFSLCRRRCPNSTSEHN
jgi:hypothetical protein